MCGAVLQSLKGNGVRSRKTHSLVVGAATFSKALMVFISSIETHDYFSGCINTAHQPRIFRSKTKANPSTACDGYAVLVDVLERTSSTNACP